MAGPDLGNAEAFRDMMKEKASAFIQFFLLNNFVKTDQKVIFAEPIIGGSNLAVNFDDQLSLRCGAKMLIDDKNEIKINSARTAWEVRNKMNILQQKIQGNLHLTEE